ncbi:MAG: TOBE domain-containing protein [Alphaproteobacteria bacterium]
MGASAPRQASPGGERVRLEGRIDEVAYSGNTSHVYLENETGVALSVTIRNQARTTVPAAPKGVGKAGGDELWMSWDAADTLVLTS